MVDRQGGTIAYRSADGRLAVLNARGNFFGVSQWLTADADARPARDPALQGEGRCDVGGCTGTLRDGRVVALIIDPRNISEDCPRADIVVTRLWLNGTCVGPGLIVDGEYLLKYGASEFRFAAAGVSARHARASQFDRPWSPAPRILTRDNLPASTAAGPLAGRSHRPAVINSGGAG